METTGHGALEDGSYDADETQETTGLGASVREEIVGHEWEGEFHAGEEEDEGEMGEVEEGVGVCADGDFFWFFFLRGGGGGRGGVVVGFWETEVEVNGFCHDEEEGEACGGGKRVGCDESNCAQPGAEGRAKSESDAEASSDESHCGASLLLVTNVGGNGHGELNIALA